ncbi:unnamed protein product [Victoria cruziana]
MRQLDRHGWMEGKSFQSFNGWDHRFTE